ncbi:MAG: ParA family protein [Casimicrobiaceae bacterium]|nr:ParA family protein [Casimicrobiaceae bacterium]
MVVASQKGGSGKTTLVRSLAVAAELGKHGPVALLDLDPQGSLTAWWNRRLAETPLLVRAEPNSLTAALDRLRANRIRLLLIDTPPSAHPFLADVVRAADHALVPVRPSPDDPAAIGPTVAMLEQGNTRFVFVLTQAKPRAGLLSRLCARLLRMGGWHRLRSIIAPNICLLPCAAWR